MDRRARGTADRRRRFARRGGRSAAPRSAAPDVRDFDSAATGLGTLGSAYERGTLTEVARQPGRRLRTCCGSPSSTARSTRSRTRSGRSSRSVQRLRHLGDGGRARSTRTARRFAMRLGGPTARLLLRRGCRSSRTATGLELQVATHAIDLGHGQRDRAGPDAAAVLTPASTSSRAWSSCRRARARGPREPRAREPPQRSNTELTFGLSGGELADRVLPRLRRCRRF